MMRRARITSWLTSGQFRHRLKRAGVTTVYSLVVLSLMLPQLLVAQVNAVQGTKSDELIAQFVEPGAPGGDPANVPTLPGVGPNPGGEIEDLEDSPPESEESTSSATPSTSSGSGSGNFSSGATEPPIQLEVVDCPGVVREINAFNLPPSIYPKPNCGPGTPAGTTGPTGVCTTDPNVQAYGTSEKAPPDNTIFWTMIGATTGTISQGFGPTDFAGGSYDNYDYTLDIQGHPGVDINSPSGTKLYTPVDGTVIVDGGTQYFLHNATVAGHTGELKIELSNGDQMVFGHMEKIKVNVGDQLKAGDYLGISGVGALPDRPGTGGPHLHLEYRKKLAHPQGEYTALDPRDVFGCVTSSTPAPDQNTAPPAEGTSGPQVQGAKTERGQVLQASTIAPDFPALQEKYGLDPVTGPSGIDFEANKENIVKLRDHAIKVAPEFDIDPEIIVMWSLTETGPPYDSYSYSHCNDMGGVIDPGETCPNNNWQVGYGQQYSVFDGIDEAWEFIYGADDSAKVQQVLQNSASQAGLSVTAPSTTAAALSAESDRFWTMIMTRDQPISAYLLGRELASDIQNAKNAGYGTRLWDFACENGWGTAYCSGSEYRQRFSNTLNDILLHWGMVGTGSSSQICQVGVSTTNSNCSTMEDVLGGMSVEEFTSRINENIDAYKRIAECADVPWEMMAAIHLRETGLDANYTGPGSNGALGPWQIDPTGALWGTVDPYDFEAAGCAVGKGELQAKAESGPLGRPLRQDMDPSKKDDEYSIKDAFFAYNGRAGFEQNIPLGCTPDLDGNPDLDFDCSAYVMNNMDANHTGMCIGTGGGNCFDDPNDGTWKTYFKLHFSTFDAEGKLLVYGGRCNLNSEVIDGYAAPTKPGLGINSQFFAPSHEGIDIANQAGDPIFALSDGDIAASGWVDRGGYYLILHIAARGDQPEMWVYYGYLEPGSFPDADTTVVAGQQIGVTGERLVVPPSGGAKIPNGLTDGPHLHFDMRRTPGDPPEQSGHINPCTLDIMKNSYPDLDC